jgi:Arc/MetJ family transcription regulator
LARLSWKTELPQGQDVYELQYAYTTSGSIAMRTNIEIDDELLSQAMTATGLSTKRATVEEGLRLLVRLRRQAKAFGALRGLGWEGDLDEMRKGRSPSWP